MSARRGSDAPKRKQRPFWKELPLLIVVALLLTFLLQTFVLRFFVVPSRSMEPTLNGCAGCVNDRVLVDRVVYGFSDIAPGDVVVFRGPPSWYDPLLDDESGDTVGHALQTVGGWLGFTPPGEQDFVKRVIAVGGQTVACCDDRGRVTVDGRALDEPYLAEAQQAPFAPVTIPPGQLWMMGDNRNDSADSRFAGHGPVPADDVIGKARLIVLPLDRSGSVGG